MNPGTAKTLSRRTAKLNKQFDHESVTRAVSRIMIGFPHILSIQRLFLLGNWQRRVVKLFTVARVFAIHACTIFMIC